MSSSNSRVHQGDDGHAILKYLAILMSWCSVWRIHVLWPILGKLQLSLAVEICLAVALLATASSRAQPSALKSPVLYAPLALFGIMLVGLPFGLYPGKSFTFVTKDFGPTLLLFLGVATSLRTPREVGSFAFAHLTGAAIYCAWVYFTIPIGPSGRLGNLIFYDANDFAVVVAASIPFAIYFARPGERLLRRAVSVVALLLFVCMIVKSGSRGGFLGLIAVTLFILIAFKAIPLRLRLGSVVGGLALMLVAGSSWYWNQMATVLHPNKDYNSYEDIGRKAIWKRGVGYMLTHPLLGVGASNFPQAEGTLSAISATYREQGVGLKWSTAHNSFVLVGAEEGVGGLLLFITMFVSAFMQLGRVRQPVSRSDPPITSDDVAFARALMASLLAFCVAGFFVSATYFAYLYVVVGLVVAHLAGMRVRARERGRAPARRLAIPETLVRVSAIGDGAWAPPIRSLAALDLDRDARVLLPS